MDAFRLLACLRAGRGLHHVAGAAFCLLTQGALATPVTVAMFADMSLEELAEIEITSVSKRGERLQDAPAAIFVITHTDIRRSGASSLPEALRLAPNLDVARVSANSYAISARGFNNAIGNKLLVLIDGRTVYTPLFSGVNWDAQHVMLEDVERIEVISGPGATLWGANAVNGVINVITKRAGETQGGLLAVGKSNQGADGAMRYGGKIGDGHYRIYGTGFNQDNSETANGTALRDGWRNRQAGFRTDWGTPLDGITVQGDAYDARKDGTSLGTPTLSGANLLARLNRQLDATSQLSIQAYYDQTKRDDPASFRDQVDTVDLEVQHSFELNTTHKILWGGGTRYAWSDTQTHRNDLPILQFLQEYRPASRSLQWHNLFVQDEISLSPELKLTVGLKAESNTYTGVEFLPGVRLAWKPDDKKLIWSSLSRAVRAPSRIDRDFFLSFYLPGGAPGPAGDFVFPLINGGPNVRSEIADVFELGYRAQPSDRLSYSVTAYYSEYDHLRSGQPPPAVVQNMMEGTTYGVESWGTYQLTEDWRLSAGMKTFRARFRLKPGSLDPDGATDAGNDADLTWMLRSTLNLSSKHDFDVMVRRVAALPSPAVPAYTAVDMRLAWRITSDVELSLIAQNLLDSAHPEFGAPASWSEVGRRIGLKALWSY